MDILITETKRVQPLTKVHGNIPNERQSSTESIYNGNFNFKLTEGRYYTLLEVIEPGFDIPRFTKKLFGAVAVMTNMGSVIGEYCSEFSEMVEITKISTDGIRIEDISFRTHDGLDLMAVKQKDGTTDYFALACDVGDIIATIAENELPSIREQLVFKTPDTNWKWGRSNIAIEHTNAAIIPDFPIGHGIDDFDDFMYPKPLHGIPHVVTENTWYHIRSIYDPATGEPVTTPIGVYELKGKFYPYSIIFDRE